VRDPAERRIEREWEGGSLLFPYHALTSIECTRRDAGKRNVRLDQRWFITCKRWFEMLRDEFLSCFLSNFTFRARRINCSLAPRFVLIRDNADEADSPLISRINASKSHPMISNRAKLRLILDEQNPPPARLFCHLHISLSSWLHSHSPLCLHRRSGFSTPHPSVPSDVTEGINLSPVHDPWKRRVATSLPRAP